MNSARATMYNNYLSNQPWFKNDLKHFMEALTE